MKPYIGDGYDEVFFIKGEPGLYPDCRINGRKMAGFQATAVVKEAATIEGGAEAESQFYCEKIAGRIRGWTYLDTDDLDTNGKPKEKPFDDLEGNKLPVNAKSLGGLAPKLLWRIRDIILGTAVSDKDPRTGAQTQTNEADEKNFATGSGSS